MHTKLPEDRRHVNFHGAYSEVESARDLLVGHALNDQVQHLSLTIAQGIQQCPP